MYLVISLLVLRAGIWDLIISVLDQCLSFDFEFCFLFLNENDENVTFFSFTLSYLQFSRVISISYVKEHQSFLLEILKWTKYKLLFMTCNLISHVNKT